MNTEMNYISYINNFKSITSLNNFYNFPFIISFIFTYAILIISLLTLNLNKNSTISTKFANHIHKLPIHSRFYMFFLFNFLLGTPPFLIFWYKLLFIQHLSLINQLFLSLFLLTINLIFSYVYLQAFFFLKKSKKSKKISITKPVNYVFLNWVLYINGMGLIFFPIICSIWL